MTLIMTNILNSNNEKNILDLIELLFKVKKYFITILIYFK